MTSITTFAYGLTVRATDLVTAASAWPQLEPVFHFFDLVYLRRKRGSLAGSSAANLVPVESWERVKQHFVEMEMEDAADSIIRSTLKRKECRDPQCALLDEERYTWSCLESIKFPCSDEEEGCSERRWNFFDDLCDGRHKFHAVIQDVVAAFGLAHPLARFIRVNQDTFSDDQCVALISIPDQFKTAENETGTALAAESGPEMPRRSAIAFVNLALPPDADSRFLKLVHTFDLEVVDATGIVQELVGPRKAAATQMERLEWTEDDELCLEGMINETVHQIRPRWQIYTTSMTDWNE